MGDFVEMMEMYETIPFGVLIIDGDDQSVAYANERFKEYFTCSEVITGKKIDDVACLKKYKDKILQCYESKGEATFFDISINNEYFNVKVNPQGNRIQMFFNRTSTHIIEELSKNENSFVESFGIVSTILETIPFYVFITDESGKIIYKNRKAFELLSSDGFFDVDNAYEFIEQSEFYFTDGRKVTITDFPFLNTIDAKQVLECLTLVYKPREETEKHVELNFYPIVEKNRVVAVLTSCRDITQEYANSEKLKSERERFLSMSTELKTKCDIIEILRNREKEHLMHLKDVINNISEGIIVFDSNNRLSLCNKSVYSIMGLKPIEITSERAIRSKFDVECEDGAVKSISLYKACIRKSIAIKNLVLKLTSKEDGNVKYIEMNSNPINKKDGLLYTIITIKDITENKIHQLMSEQQANFITNVVNTLDIPIVVLDYPDMKFKLVNKSYEYLMQRTGSKFSIDDCLGKSLMEVFKNTYQDNPMYHLIKRVGETKKEITYSPFIIDNKDGEGTYYKLKFIPYEYGDGTVRIHVHGSDITDEINHNLELEKVTKLKDEFFTVISHELRTPLTIIYSSLQLAYDIYNNEITENIDKTLARINQNCSRLLKLINNILDISKAEAGFLTLNNCNFDLIYQSEAIVNSANFYAENKNINLIFDTNEEECTVKLDKDKYEKILLNLLSNAVKFTPEGKNIYVTLDVKDDYFYLIVKDEGIGIPENKIESIFDRFAQVNSSLSRRAEGTGIGLALVKKLIELMGGTIEVKSKVGVGTEFMIKFKIVCAEMINSDASNAILSEAVRDRINIEFSDVN